MINKNYLISSINKASNSLKKLLNKFEADCLIKMRDNISVSDFVFNDIISFVMFSVGLSDKIQESDIDNLFYDLIASFDIEAKENVLKDFISQYTLKNEKNSCIFPESFILLNLLDQNLLFSDGAFYKKLGVNNPGPISNYYILIIESIDYLISNLFNDDKVHAFLQNSIYMMREEQLDYYE